MRDTVLFDLDGTLVDTAPDLVRVTNRVVAQDGRGPGEFVALRNQVGLGALHLIREAYGDGLSEMRGQELLEQFLRVYEGSISEASKPFPHVAATLRALAQDGYALEVCTNKPGALARKLLGELGLAHMFARIVGSRDGTRTKPHSDHVFAAAGHREAQRIVLVGDSDTDILAARNARVPCVLVAYGYSDVPPHTLKPDALIRDFRELPDALKEL